jgi:hypothetical protein
MPQAEIDAVRNVAVGVFEVGAIKALSMPEKLSDFGMWYSDRPFITDLAGVQCACFAAGTFADCSFCIVEISTYKFEVCN